jgi:two-component system invasion response regulator UvrY
MHHFLIADGHSVSRRGLRQILVEAFPSAIIEEVSNGEDLLKRSMEVNWDVVVSDISMSGRTGLEILLELRLVRPKVPFLIVSAHSEDKYAIRALNAGASGYLNKEFDAEELVGAVNQLLLGKRYISHAIAEMLARTLDRGVSKMPHQYLSNRELEVFKLLATGKSVSQVAEGVFLKVNTVSTFRSRIMSKMNLKTNADLIVYAMEQKLL